MRSGRDGLRRGADDGIPPPPLALREPTVASFGVGARSRRGLARRRRLHRPRRRGSSAPRSFPRSGRRRSGCRSRRPSGRSPRGRDEVVDRTSADRSSRARGSRSPARSASSSADQASFASGVTPPETVTSLGCGRGEREAAAGSRRWRGRRCRETRKFRNLIESPYSRPVLDARRLVLVVVVLQRLGETDGGKTRLDEGTVVAAAPEAVEAEDQPDRRRGPAVSSTVRARSREGESTPSGPPPGEDADAVRRAGREIRADDVVVQEAADLVALLLQVLEQALAAEEALLLSGDGGEEERRAVRALREEPRALDRDGHARGVVVRAGRVGFRIHHGGGHRVVVPRHEEDGFGRASGRFPAGTRARSPCARGLSVRARRRSPRSGPRSTVIRPPVDFAICGEPRGDAGRARTRSRAWDPPRRRATAACRRRRALRSSRSAAPFRPPTGRAITRRRAPGALAAGFRRKRGSAGSCPAERRRGEECREQRV